MADTPPAFQGGVNIALKIPSHLFARTVAFYRDALRLPLLPHLQDTSVEAGSVAFQFGPCRLWLDNVPHQDQASVWLELRSEDPHAAMAWLEARDVPNRDALEPLPPDLGHWISDPAGTVLLLSRLDDADGTSSPGA